MKKTKKIAHLIRVQDQLDVKLPRAEVWPIPWMRRVCGRPWEGLRMLGLWPLHQGPTHQVSTVSFRHLVVRTSPELMAELCADIDESLGNKGLVHLAALESVEVNGETLFRLKDMGQLNMAYAVFAMPHGYEAAAPEAPQSRVN